ncbi:hypothetical protein N7539_008033 [Penicillium diatomitis]|uniref:Uncharacterized protein n=1 Tax=Penicillium diatomitis TaxID=2819901 RepID=A0A9W9WTR4_9EURO|nr:uncharacterized protein N7539_008033 [Penicillium diatomitis]KAJ5474967.1 hypothetical protein N7539_008033 [Penicillium diatomitis]
MSLAVDMGLMLVATSNDTLVYAIEQGKSLVARVFPLTMSKLLPIAAHDHIAPSQHRRDSQKEADAND